MEWRADVSAPQPLSEDSLNNKTIVVNLTGDSFADNMLAAASFSLQNAPAGLAIGRINYDSTTQCAIELTYDGTDFDTDISNLQVMIKGAELAGSSGSPSGGTKTDSGKSAPNGESAITAEVTRGSDGKTSASVTVTGNQVTVAAPANSTIVEVNLPKAAVSGAADSNTTGLTVTSPIAAMLPEGTQQVIGDRQVFNFSVTSGGQTISKLGGNVTVSVPYTPKAGEDTNAIVIYDINEEGKKELL